MKIKVTMKDPDVLHDAIRRSVRNELEKIEGLDEDERESMEDARIEKAADKCSRWFRWGEYLTVEVDIDAGTCTVLEDA